MARIRSIKPGGSNAPVPYKKASIPLAARRELALRYGCQPGGQCEAACHYCGKVARIWWQSLSNGKPGSWVHFGHEIDHVTPESLGGRTTADNLVLACQSCNRRKGARL